MRLLIFEQLKSEKGIPYTRTHVRRKAKAGTFPKPIAISDKRIGWVEEEVDAWLEALKKQRDAEERAPERRALPRKAGIAPPA